MARTARVVTILETETIVIGAGVVGLACAASLATAGQEVLVLERNSTFGEETSARNSEVIHAGIYYQPGSLKARLCVRGKKLLYHYCRQRSIPYDRIGKLIVAADERDRRAVLKLVDKGKSNGVDDLRWLDRLEMHGLEPELTGVGALHSPSTGVVNSHTLMLSLIGDIESHGGAISYLSRVESLRSESRNFLLEVSTGSEQLKVRSRRLINCAGLGAVQLARTDSLSSKAALPAPFYTKGNYFKVNARVPFNRLIYPAPVAGGLGVHLTLDLDGNPRFGPDVEPVASADASLAVDQKRAQGFYQSIRRYWPALPDDSLQADYAGIRPKLKWADDLKNSGGADFAILDSSYHGVTGLLHCLGIESPGLTSSLAIAELVAKQVDG